DYLYYALRLFNKEHFDFNYIDALYACRIAKRGEKNVSFQHLPRCHGFVETNLGKGVLWQRIRNFDGSDCFSLRDCYLTPGLLGENERKIIRAALDQFFAWQMKNAIMLREMAFANTLVCRIDPQTIRLYHVDAIGCADIVPLANHARWFARMRIWSKIRSFRKQITKWLDGPLEK
ncbi:MAG TPA: YrbL family protein, partial [Desulfopila sp.]|nr:YrbL family protein [Desulfopila sp.]